MVGFCCGAAYCGAVAVGATAGATATGAACCLVDYAGGAYVAVELATLSVSRTFVTLAADFDASYPT